MFKCRIALRLSLPDGRLGTREKGTGMEGHETDGRGVCRAHGHVCTVVRSPLLPDWAAVHAEVNYKGTRYMVVNVRDAAAGIEVQLSDGPHGRFWRPLGAVSDPHAGWAEEDAAFERRADW